MVSQSMLFVWMRYEVGLMPKRNVEELTVSVFFS